MEEVQMYDAFHPPAPSQSTLEWLASGSIHELAPRVDVVQWQSTETACSALNSLRREIMVVDQPVAGPSTSSYFPKIGSFTSTMSLSRAQAHSTRPSTSTAGIGILPSRRKIDRHTRPRRPLVGDTPAEEPSILSNQPAPELDNIIRNVVGAIDKEAELRNMAEKRKQRGKALSASGSRPLVRTTSARPLQAPKRPAQTLSRHMSEESLDSTNVTLRSRTKEREHLADMEWVPNLFKADIQTGSRVSVEDSGLKVGHSTRGTAVVPDKPAGETMDARSRERSSKVHKFAIQETKTMPPPPPPARVQHRPPQLKHARSPSPVPMDLVPTQPATQVSSRHPPVLGMRRLNGHGVSVPFQSSQNIPNKQRGFKTPFARPDAGGFQVSSTSMSSVTMSRPSYEKSGSYVASTPSPSSGPSKPQPKSRSPSPTLEADSSYGEISFDMDIVEETMKQYDEV